MLRDNMNEIEGRIRAACERSGRNREEIKLISVSKTKPVPILQECYDFGNRLFGENKVQEILYKAPLLPNDISWHMIGHLQKNKVRSLLGTARLIHSVDSYELAYLINKESANKELQTDVLIEVNISNEASKYGVSKRELIDLLYKICDLRSIHVLGLMTICPFTEDPENNREYFKKMYELFVDIRSKNIDNIVMKELSMGMTGDFEQAIEEGATYIRIGTGIFGER